MAGALNTVRAVLRLPSLRRLVAAFLAFSLTEWASWIGLVVCAYSRGGPAEADLGVAQTSRSLAGQNPGASPWRNQMPHPTYARQHWVSVLNPSSSTFDDVVVPLLRLAYDPAGSPAGPTHASRNGEGTGAISPVQ